MVNPTIRRKLAEQLRHFASGVWTVDEWEERSEMQDRHDPAIAAIWWTIWTTYDDFRTERLRRSWRLEGEARDTVARCILFLYSGYEYRWSHGYKAWLLNLLTFGGWTRKQDSDGDEECWPFFNYVELQEACKRPRFFTGTVVK